MPKYNDFDDLVASRDDFATPEYMRTKQDFAEAYEAQYGKGWKKQLESDIRAAGFKYGRRNFDADRINRKLNPKLEKEFEKFGKTKDPKFYKPNANGYRIKFTGDVVISEDEDSRNFTKTISSMTAYDLINNPSVAGIMELHFKPGVVRELGTSYSISVEPL